MSLEKAHQAASLYKHRWKIETFFRTCKQRFGLCQCQARSLQKQKAHCLAVFLAYIKIQKPSMTAPGCKNNIKQNNDMSSYSDFW